MSPTDIIQTRYPPGVLITTSSLPKFYSNGLDLDHVNATPHFFRDSLYPLWRKLITYPMPTVALLNGHAFAGGLMLAMFHDYRIMNPHKGYVCLNEVELGVELRPGMSAVFRQKMEPQTYRRMVLEGVRFKVSLISYHSPLCNDLSKSLLPYHVSRRKLTLHPGSRCTQRRHRRLAWWPG